MWECECFCSWTLWWIFGCHAAPSQTDTELEYTLLSILGSKSTTGQAGAGQVNLFSSYPNCKSEERSFNHIQYTNRGHCPSGHYPGSDKATYVNKVWCQLIKRWRWHSVFDNGDRQHQLTITLVAVAQECLHNAKKSCWVTSYQTHWEFCVSPTMLVLL